jgi:hypothetical protein
MNQPDYLSLLANIPQNISRKFMNAKSLSMHVSILQNLTISILKHIELLVAIAWSLVILTTN